MKRIKKPYKSIVFEYLKSRNFQPNKTGLIEFLLYEDKLPYQPTKLFQYHQYINYYYANKTIKELLEYL